MSQAKIADVQDTDQAPEPKAKEGPVAKAIEKRTAQIPSDIYLWAAAASIAGSAVLQVMGNQKTSLFVGQWVPSFLLLGLYNKVVKVAGHDAAT